MRELVYAPPEDALIPVYEDDDILIINKPAGLLSVPGKASEHKDCVESRLKTRDSSVLTVHRLDLATSGLMIFARNKNAQRHLGLQFEKRQVEKMYIADVWGHMESENGEVYLPLRCDWPNRPLQMVCHEHGKPALTQWQLTTQNADTARLALSPKTGRSHQLRVHMQSLGHPILGDRFYAHDEAYHAAKRLHLHAAHIRFRHPTGGAWVEFDIPCPF